MTDIAAMAGNVDIPQRGTDSDTGGPRPHRGKLLVPDPVLRHERKGRLGGRWINRFGWLLLSIVLGLALLFGVTLAISIPMGIVAELRGEGALFEAATTLEDVAPGNGYAFVMLALVGIGFAVPVFVLSKIIHGQWWAALTYDAPFRWYNFVKAATALAFLMLIGVAYGVAMHPENYRATSVLTDPPPFYTIWFGIGLLAILVQSFGEEFLFRGLLPRLLGAVVPFRLIVVGLVMLLFISLHAANPDVKIDLWFVLLLFVGMEILNFTILFRTRSIAATWGVHWVNNSFVFLLVSSEPGRTSSMTPFVYTDPTWTSGGSYLLNPQAYLEFGAGLLILCAMLLWKRSPFYLPWHDEVQ